ncbi:MAG TPA: BlaI/MecI/CopY family transcriptional regulator [Terriglobia bacterium]|nr:BlaI/MecI/CopY family transcriptional regulator [Terriglobia bacterium]
MLTPLELDIMKAVWQRYPISVKDVQTAIQPSRPLAYTTVMTIMHRLYLKGFLHRALKSRSHYYEPTVGFADVRDAAVNGMIDHFFQGSRDQFIRFMGDDGHEEVREVAGPAFDDTLL